MLIDVNCVHGHWPFLRLDPARPEALAAHLQAEGIRRALIYSMDAVLSPDVETCNQELADACRGSEVLLPVPTLDVSMPQWRRSLERCRRAGWPGAVRLVPRYHRYALADAAVDALAAELQSEGATLILQVRVDDERGQYPLMKVPALPVADIAALAERHPGLRLLCLGCYLPEATHLAQAGPNVYLDTSFIEVLDTLRVLLADLPAERLALGSYTPIFYTRANTMKVTCADVRPEQREQVAWRTAVGLIPGLRRLTPA